MCPINDPLRGFHSAERPSPLHIAIEKGDVSEVEELLQRADIKIDQTFQGYTPLHYAIINKHEQIVDELLKKGADVNKAVKGWTCVELAMGDPDVRDPKIVTQLIQHGVDVDNTKAISLLNFMQSFKDDKDWDKVYDLILKNTKNINARTCDGFTPLEWAIIKEDDAAIEKLIANGADVNQFCKGLDNSKLVAAINIGIVGSTSQMSLLDLACMLRIFTTAGKPLNDNVLKMLLKSSTPIEIQPENIPSLVSFVLAKENLALTNELKLIDKLLASEKNIPMLFHAVMMKENREVAEKLGLMDKILARIKNVNTPIEIEGNRSTLMHLAISADNEEGVLKLINKGADPNSTIEGVPLLEFAVKSDKWAAVDALSSQGATMNYKKCLSNVLSEKEGQGRLKMAEKIILTFSTHIDINTPNKNGDTILHLALAKGKKDLAKSLVSWGARLDIKNKQGKTPVDIMRGGRKYAVSKKEYAEFEADVKDISKKATGTKKATQDRGLWTKFVKMQKKVGIDVEKISQKSKSFVKKNVGLQLARSKKATPKTKETTPTKNSSKPGKRA